MQNHPWFEGIEWDRLYEMEAAFIPNVRDELDTQNFEKFEEVKTFLLSYCLLILLTAPEYESDKLYLFLLLQAPVPVQSSPRPGPWRKVNTFLLSSVG